MGSPLTVVKSETVDPSPVLHVHLVDSIRYFLPAYLSGHDVVSLFSIMAQNECIASKTCCGQNLKCATM